MTRRSAFYPILGERVWGWWGHIIDMLAVFATLFGLNASLGLGAQQVAFGVQEIFAVEPSNMVVAVLIIGITGLHWVRFFWVWIGVKRLSEINMIMAVVLFLLVFFVTDTILAITRYVDALIDYLLLLPALSNPFGREAGHGGLHGHLSWVCASHGYRKDARYVNSFCALWMSTCGGTAIDMLNAGSAEAVRATVIDSYKPEGPVWVLAGIAALQHRCPSCSGLDCHLLCNLIR